MIFINIATYMRKEKCLMKKLVVAIDFCNFVFLSYYGEKLFNSKGENVNAIKGFFFKLKSIKDSLNPDLIVFANDLSRERTFRRKLYKKYKAQRKPRDPDIMNQMQKINQMCALIGYPFINNELYEADDILGMISRYNTERDVNTIIVSSDRDLYQLVNDNTFILSPRSNDFVDRAFMAQKYQLTPEQWIEYKILRGDQSDNIPGIPGIGEVTALKLMQKYGSIENIYSRMMDHNPGVRRSLLAGENLIPLTRDLVTIITDYTKIDLTNDMMQPLERYQNEVYSLIEEWEIYSLFNIMNYSLFVDKIQEEEIGGNDE